MRKKKRKVAMTRKAQRYISTIIRREKRAGKEGPQAAAIAYEKARKRGYRIPTRKYFENPDAGTPPNDLVQGLINTIETDFAFASPRQKEQLLRRALQIRGYHSYSKYKTFFPGSQPSDFPQRRNPIEYVRKKGKSCSVCGRPLSHREHAYKWDDTDYDCQDCHVLTRKMIEKLKPRRRPVAERRSMSFIGGGYYDFSPHFRRNAANMKKFWVVDWKIGNRYLMKPFNTKYAAFAFIRRNKSHGVPMQLQHLAHADVLYLARQMAETMHRNPKDNPGILENLALLGSIATSAKDLIKVNPLKRATKVSMMKRRNPSRGEADQVWASEIYSMATTLGDRTDEVFAKNMITKMARGTYDREKGVKLFSYMAKQAWEKYKREYGVQTFPGLGATLMEAGRKLERDFYERAQAGEFDHLKPKKYRKNVGGLIRQRSNSKHDYEEVPMSHREKGTYVAHFRDRAGRTLKVEVPANSAAEAAKIARQMLRRDQRLLGNPVRSKRGSMAQDYSNPAYHGKVNFVRDIPDHFQLVTDSQEVKHILSSIGRPRMYNKVQGLFVEVLEGEYGTIYGFQGTVPRLDKPVYRIQSLNSGVRRVKAEMRVNPDDTSNAFDAGKHWRLSGGADSSGVANARVVKYGFIKWWNEQAPAFGKGNKARLFKAFREGYAAGKRVEKAGTRKGVFRYDASGKTYFKKNSMPRGPSLGGTDRHNPNYRLTAADREAVRDRAYSALKTMSASGARLKYTRMAAKATKGHYRKFYQEVANYIGRISAATRGNPGRRRKPIRRAASRAKSNPRKGQKLIYGRVLSISATQNQSDKRYSKPRDKWQHKFREPGTKIYGNADGSVTIKGRKRLWKEWQN